LAELANHRLPELKRCWKLWVLFGLFAACGQLQLRHVASIQTKPERRQLALAL
jgi:hypothetical protein